MPEILVITGAAGQIGRDLRERLARPGRILRLIDIAAQAPAGSDEAVEIINADITDPDAMTAASEGAVAVIHLAALLDGATWAQYADVNITGTYAVLEGARRAGVSRVIYASSHHAVGFNPRGDWAPDDMLPRPDSYYGVTKVASEALCSLYHDRHGMDIVAVRIASYRPVPDDRRSLSNWLSPDDTARLLEALLVAPAPGFQIVWGVSKNTRRWMSLEKAEGLGYAPQDDAEQWAGDVLSSTSPEDAGAQWDHILGAKFAAPDFDARGRSA